MNKIRDSGQHWPIMNWRRIAAYKLFECTRVSHFFYRFAAFPMRGQRSIAPCAFYSPLAQLLSATMGMRAVCGLPLKVLIELNFIDIRSTFNSMSVTRVSFVSIAFCHHYCAADTEQTLAASCPFPKTNLHYVGYESREWLSPQKNCPNRGQNENFRKLHKD